MLKRAFNRSARFPNAPMRLRSFMDVFIQKMADNPAVDIIKEVLSSKFFPFITAAVALLFYYLGWDMATIYYMAFTGIACVLLLEDLTPLITVFLFMSVMISRQNSPSPLTGDSAFYSNPAVLAQGIALIGLFAAAVIYRIVVIVKEKKLRFTPTFWGLCGLSVAFICNGFFMYNYNPMNLVYGIFMSFFFFGIFVLMFGGVKLGESCYVKIALSFFAMSILLFIEMCVLYLTTEGIIVKGEIVKEVIVFGWGIWNTMGMMLTVSIPMVLYLAAKSKYGYLFFLYSMVLVITVFLTTSRQAMLATAIVYPISVIVLLVKGKNRLVNLIITALAVTVALIVAVKFWDKIIVLFDSVLDKLTNEQGIFSGNGRVDLIKIALETFEKNPVFGGGFYVDLVAAPNFDGMDIIPDMYHNTFMQMLASCGFVGFVAYMVYRTQTVIAFFRRPTTPRTFIALSLFALLIMGMFDNHIFYILPTLFYSSLIAVIVKGEDKNSELEI